MFPVFKSQSFIVRLTGVFLSLFIGIFFIASLILGLKWSSILINGLDARGNLKAETIRAELNSLVEHTENLGIIYSSLLNNSQDNPHTKAYQETILPLLNGYKNILDDTPYHTASILIGYYNALASPDKHWCLYTFSPQDGHVSPVELTSPTIDWYSKTIHSEKPFWLNHEKLTASASPASIYIHPFSIKTDSHPIKGFIAFEIPFHSIKKHIGLAHVEGNGVCRVYDAKGNLVAEDIEVDGEESAYRKVIASSLKNDENEAYNLSNISVYEEQSNNGWNIVVYMSNDWVKGHLLNMLFYILVIFIVTAPIVILVSFLLTKKIVTPLTNLTKAVEAIGNGRFNVKLPKYDSSDEIGQLARSFEQMQHELVTYVQELKKSAKQQKSMESELNIAKTIQSGILPKLESAFIESEPFDLEAVLIPAKAVGGDLYDFFFIDERHLVLIIGDVSGKGIPAAMFMSVTQTLQRSITFRFKEPAEIVTQLNRMLLSNNSATMFVTYFIAVIDTCSGTMSYCNAGHNPPIIRKHNGDLKTLEDQHGLPLGIFEENYSSNSITLEPNDTLVLYTDGVTEAFNPRSELFGEIRLKEAISYAMSPDPHKIVHTILNHMEIFVEGHEQSDDITLLSMQMLDYFCPVPSQKDE